MLTKIMFHINSLGKGGAERVVVNLAEQFAQNDIDVIIATEWKAEDEYALTEKVRRIHVGLSEQEMKSSAGRQRKIRKNRLKEQIILEQPDLIYSFCRNANYRAVLAAAGTKVPVVISVRSDPSIDYAGKIQKLISSILYRRAAGAVFQTTEARDFFPRSIRSKSRVILNPLNEKYLAVPKAKQRRKAIVTAGRFHEAKDQLVLIKAFERLREDFPDYVLELYGDASEDNTLQRVKEYIKSQHLENAVLLMGNSNELEKRLVDAAVFVLSSKYEGMPNALMEAMAMQIPVVATDCPCGGPRTLIEDGINGLLVKVGDDKEMADAIRKYLQHPEQAEEVAVRGGKITQIASPQKIASEWLSYGMELSQRRKGGNSH